MNLENKLAQIEKLEQENREIKEKNRILEEAAEVISKEKVWNKILRKVAFKTTLF